MMAQQATAPAEIRDTEITLGTGKLLAAFFGLVAVCGIFFALGYNLGRGSIPVADPNVLPAPTATTSGGSKPSAVVTSAPAVATSSPSPSPAAQTTNAIMPVSQPPTQPSAPDAKPDNASSN